MEAGNALLDEHALALTGAECPRVCFLPTASGDADHYVVRFYRHFPAGRCEPSHISLFRRDCGTQNLSTISRWERFRRARIQFQPSIWETRRESAKV